MSEPHQRDEDLSDAAVVKAIADADSRAILRATATEPKLVADLADECEIPSATAYRKVNRLTNAGLLIEQIRIRPNERNAAEYQLCDKEISVTVGESIDLEISCSPASRDQVEVTPAADSDGTSLHLKHMMNGSGESLDDASRAQNN